MKQAQVDADELIAAYRLEQQDAFDKKANADGKLNILIREQSIIVRTPRRLITLMFFLTLYPVLFTPVMNTLYMRYYCSLLTGGSGGNASAKLQAETNADIQNMQGQFQSNAQKAVDVLLSKCCEVSLEVPTARIRSTQKIYGK